MLEVLTQCPRQEGHVGAKACFLLFLSGKGRFVKKPPTVLLPARGPFVSHLALPASTGVGQAAGESGCWKSFFLFLLKLSSLIGAPSVSLVGRILNCFGSVAPGGGGALLWVSSL